MITRERSSKGDIPVAPSYSRDLCCLGFYLDGTSLTGGACCEFVWGSPRPLENSSGCQLRCELESWLDEVEEGKRTRAWSLVIVWLRSPLVSMEQL